MSPRFVLGWENVPCVAEVVNRSLKADCTDSTCLVIVTSWNTKTFLAKKLKKLCFVLAGLAALYFECRVTCVAT